MKPAYHVIQTGTGDYYVSVRTETVNENGTSIKVEHIAKVKGTWPDAAAKADALAKALSALEQIRDIKTGDCERYVVEADTLACTALARLKTLCG